MQNMHGTLTDHIYYIVHIQVLTVIPLYAAASIHFFFFFLVQKWKLCINVKWYLCKMYWSCSAWQRSSHLPLHYTWLIFKLSKLLLGGGGAKQYVCPPPNIFIGGGGRAAPQPPPPPPPGSTPLFVCSCWLTYTIKYTMKLEIENEIHVVPRFF